MYKAYIYADPVEDPLVIEDLCSRLRKQGITPYLTERSWKNIFSKEPFLYFRNPYIRFDSMLGSRFRWFVSLPVCEMLLNATVKNVYRYHSVII